MELRDALTGHGARPGHWGILGSCQAPDQLQHDQLHHGVHGEVPVQGCAGPAGWLLASQVSPEPGSWVLTGCRELVMVSMGLQSWAQV